MEPANDTTPPAYDFRDGLRIWQDGEVVAIIPPSYYANLTLELVKQMKRETDG